MQAFQVPTVAAAAATAAPPKVKPLLDQDNIKAQFNSIVSPYGIFFFDNDNLCVQGSLRIQSTLSTEQGAQQTQAALELEVVRPFAARSIAEYEDVNVNHPDGESGLKDIRQRSGWRSLDGEENRTKVMRDFRGQKSGLKLAKGWKKLRASMRQGAVNGHDAGKRSRVRGPHSSVTKHRESTTNASSLLQLRKTLSDLDSPAKVNQDDGGLSLGKGLRAGLGLRFRSGSFKILLHKSSSASSLLEFETGDIPPSTGRGDDTKDSLQGGAVVVSVDSIMTLGKMRQYSKEDLLHQQQEQQKQRQQYGSCDQLSLSKSKLPEPESGYGSSLNSLGDESRGYEDELQSLNESLESNVPSLVRKDPRDQSLQETDHQDLGLNEDTSETITQYCWKDEKSTAGHVKDSLNQDVSSPLTWRLSMMGAPNVFGSIGEKRPESLTNDHYLRQLVRDSTYQDQGSTENANKIDDIDCDDKVFGVPLKQSVELASATFENGYKIPLAVYYFADEICKRVASASVEKCTTVNELFPEDWGRQEGSLEMLLHLFDSRPFGQGVCISIDTLDSNAESALSYSQESRLVPGLNQPVQSSKVEDGPNQSEDEDTTADTQKHGSRLNVSSANLSRAILRFLHNLPQPLIPQDVYSTFVALVQLETLDSIKIQASSLLIQLLTQEQKQLLQFLLELLHDVVLKPLRDSVQNPNATDVRQSSEHERVLLQYKQLKQRLYTVMGMACTHAASSSDRGGASKSLGQDDNSLYRHYKKEIEQNALQEKRAAEMRQAGAVFRHLLVHRVNVFGPSSFQLGAVAADAKPSNNGSKDSDVIKRQDAFDFDSRQEPIEENEQPGSDDSPAAQPLQHTATLDSLYPRPTTSSKRSPKSVKARRWIRNRRHRTTMQIDITEARRISRHYYQDATAEKEPSSDVPCDSAVEVTCNIDLLAATAMQKHAEQVSRSKGHRAYPSLVTLHSIQAHGEENSPIINNSDNTRSVKVDDEIQTQVADEEASGNEDISAAELSVVRADQEREVQMVEKEILQSEITTKFLTVNLTGLYPSSAPTAIPPAILPSVRAIMMAQSAKTGELLKGAASAINMPDDEPSLSKQGRELKLTPQEKIQLPLDHCATESCTCSYCTTQIKPSKIPVLTKTEYELAELRSQSESKDQHITELLKTVQNLQGQVNILNAKLLFLHDHHTTRPMQRRMLARNGYPVMQTGIDTIRRVGSAESVLSERPRNSLRSSGSSSYISESSSYISESSSALAGGYGITRAFSEGVQVCSDSELHRGETHHSPETPLLNEREDMPYLHPKGGLSESLLPAFGTLQAQQPGPTSIDAMGIESNGGHGPFPSWVQSSRVSSRANGPVYMSELERVLRDLDAMEAHQKPYYGQDQEEDEAPELLQIEEEAEEPEREGEDQVDEYYYMDAYKPMDQQLYRRPIFPVTAPPRPMSTEAYRKHYRMSLPVQSLVSKRISLGNTFRWKGWTTSAARA
ncbi:hypothetical protein EDD11_005721 [Mortierella claussenii]|nr:hypothetical protein EDD11_005721 [Mortierella claussenii]